MAAIILSSRVTRISLAAALCAAVAACGKTKYVESIVDLATGVAGLGSGGNSDGSGTNTADVAAQVAERQHQALPWH